MLVCVVFLSSQTFAQTLSIEASSNKSDILTGETFTYTLKYSCAAGTGDCPNVTMTATIPSSISFPNQVVGLTTDIDSYTFSADRRTATFTFKNPLKAGNTGIIELLGQGDFGKVDGTTGTMTASIVSGSGTPATATVNTTLHSSNKFCPAKANGRGLAIDNSTFYDIYLQFPGNYGSTGIGTTSVSSVVMVDNLPANAVINGVTATALDGWPTPSVPSGTCVVDNTPGAPKVTCTFPASTFQIGSAYAPRVLVKIDVTYPSGSFSAGDNVTNNVTVAYTPDGGSPITATNGSTITYQGGATYATQTTESCTPTLTVTDKLVAPEAKLAIAKGTSSTKIRPGDVVLFEFSASNTGNVPLNNVVLEDILPADLRGTAVNQVSKVNMAGTETITYWVKTNVQTTYFQVLMTDYTYVPPSGEYITHFKTEISSLPAGALVQYGGIRVTLAPGSTATSVTNCLTAVSSTPGVTITPASACQTIPVAPLDNYSSLLVHKWLTSEPLSQYALFYGTPQNIGTTVWSMIQAVNMSGGQPLQNPVVMDLLPVGLSYDGAIQYVPTSCNFPPANNTEIIPNYNGTGRTLVRLSWNIPMPSGCDVWFSIKTKINTLGTGGNLSSNEAAWAPKDAYSQPVGIKNPAFFTGSSKAKCFQESIYETMDRYETVDKFDLDGDGSKADTICFRTGYIGLTSVAQLESVKWVKGQCDTVYSKHPDFGQTMPGGIANYKLIVRNNGNVPASSIEVLDMLPYIGDIGVKDLTARLTQWRPNLVTPLITPTGVTVYYTTVQNPCRTDYVASGPSGCNPPNWTTVLPADPTTVQGLKFDFGTKILNPGDEVELTWDMRAPVNAPTNGEIAWNSFAFKAKRNDNNDPFLPAEPNKVGIKLKPLVPGVYGNRVWIDANKNGSQDTGEVGVDGVRVELHQDNGDGIADPKNDPLISYTATGNGGLYLFPNLAPGNYFAVFFVPAGYSTTTPNVVTPGDSLDSDGVPTLCNGQRVTVVDITTIDAAEVDLRWDQGIYLDKAALGNYVWFDQNLNNVQDESTTNGVNGVIVCLYKDNGDGIAQPDAADGAPVARDTTSNDIYGRPGYYLFENLDPGKYFVKFKLATGQTFTTNTGTVNGTSDETDSDPTSTGVTEVTELTAGEVDLTWDAGIIIPTGPYNLGNLVWNDANNNGKVDGTETGINGVTVILFEDRNNNNKPDPDEYVTTTITATVGGLPGIYTFTNLPAGNYIVQVPDGNFNGPLKDFASSTGNDPAPDPDDDVENDDNGTAVVGCGIISKPITLGSNAEPLDNGKTNYSVDFGFYKCTKPNYTVTVTQPTCAGGKGSIVLGTGTIGDKVTYTTGDASTLATYANATLISSLTGGVIVGNINNPPMDVTYLVRIYNGEDGCFKDFTFTIKPLSCCTKPVAVAMPKTQTICAGGTVSAYTATPSTGVQYKWYGPLADTTSSLGTAVSGATSSTFTPSGAALTTAGTKYYAVVVNTTGDLTCADTAYVQLVVNAKPVIADGFATICAGESVDLTTKITNYNTYLSPVWTVGTAGGTAVAMPTSVKPTGTTTYVLVAQNAAGCKDTANVVVTVNPKPNAGKDTTLACVNAANNTLATSYTLVPSPAGGSWSQLGTTPATATISGNNVTGMSLAGMYQFIYTTTAGCKDTVAITVAPCAGCVKPNAGADAANVCQPTSTAKLTAVTTGGTWAPIVSPANPSAATIDANGNISGLNAAGTYKFVYSITSGGQTCTDTAQVIVLAKPVIADGSATICAGESVDLTTKITNYNTYLSPVWTVGTANGTAVATPTSVKPTGTTTYVLVAQNAAGCKDTANVVVTVNPKPNAGKDTTLACVNAATNTLATSYTLVPSPTGGSWSQLGTTPTTATITGNNVTGMSVAGTYQFIYTTTAGCKDTVAVTVAPCAGCVKPNAGADAASVCQPTSTAKLTAVTTGGTWAPIGSPANPSAATIDANGNISGLNAAGTYKFVYSVTSGGQTCTDTAQVVVLAKPVIADGSATICAGESVDLTSKITNYNTYLSPVWTVGTAGGTAVATPSSVKPTGTTTYVLVAQNAAGCKDTANVVVTVNPKPNAGKDTTLACVNAANNTLATSYTLVPSPAGGSWSQLGTTPIAATISGNNVTGMSVAGTYQFIYTTTAGCKDTVAVTVAPCAGCVKPNAGADAASVCQPTSTAKLTAVTTGGTWAPIGSPANPSAATIDASGNISGLNAAGTYKFIYSITSGGQTCTDTAQVIVLAMPVIADGSATICAGESVDLTTKITNYNSYQGQVWTVGTAGGTAVATPTSVKPTGTTTYVLIAQNAAGCKDTANVVVTVNPKPNAGKDTTLVCSNGNVPSSVQLSATPTGGTWSALTGNPTGATVNSAGLVSITNATAQGKSFDFVYTLNGCQDTVKVIVPTCPAPCIKSSISSAAPVCSNDAQTYSFTFTVANKLGIVKVNKGTLSGNNPYTVSGIPSGQNVIITDSLSAICKSDTTIVGVNCNCNPALPQLLTPSLTACIGDTFPTLKAAVVGLATVEWFSQQTGGTVLATGLSFKPSGTVSANTVFYAQARSTDPTCPTAVSTSRVPATINAQTCIDTIDLALKKLIDKKIARVGDVLTYTIKVWNEWTKNATGVEVTDSIATTVQFVSGSFVASRGSATISGNVIKWTIGNIAANGDTVTLRYQVKATQAGIHLNTAEISKTNEKDKDSTPGNGKGGEDDIDQQCFTVPFGLCAGQKLEVGVPANLTNVQWFKNGGTAAVATGNVVLFSEVGVYTFTATNQTCPANGCCPVIIEAGTNCCPVDLCIPYTVKKVRK
ncbi:putative repeat protein (TIGR01451 family) [Runella defluvii]|uniref:Putative repeat protein (TIGR01451 family) n=1 Tax=Runella defluvii TaxID=370973 RepID=A0A7W6EU38_9BACT|nr:SdrD B-like domain-containing protein [Runella defluvii]MBB3842177.1 putative repeat protein (TIGR01451 family) [Runella defluvii]